MIWNNSELYTHNYSNILNFFILRLKNNLNEFCLKKYIETRFSIVQSIL